MTELARKLRLTDYFTLGWGTMVGVGWLVVMDDWLARGGPLGAILGFAIGGSVLLPIAYVYGQLIAAMPDAAGEIAYTAKVFPRAVSFATGWMMLLSYFVVCPWEAVAVGRIAAFIFPALDRFELYRVAGKPVFLPQLVLGVGLTIVLTILNYRGIRVSATFQNWTTFCTLGLFVVFVSFGAAHGSAHNFPPLFSHTPLLSIILVIHIVPYFMAGFESVAKCAEEATPEFRSGNFLRAMWMAIIVAIVFYTIIIAAVAYASPWQNLPSGTFSTAVAFERALGSRWIVSLILTAALLSLLKVFNGNFIAASRLLFALGRRGLINHSVGSVHPRNQTPAIAVILMGIATAVAMFLGEAILVPITEVGSAAAAIGWFAACAAYLRMQPVRAQRAVALAGILIAIGLALMKLLPFVPGHFTGYEWVALTAWLALGLLLHRPAVATRTRHAKSGAEA
jgi:amino acid transporter